MTRVKTGIVRKRRHNKTLGEARGFRQARRVRVKVAKEAVLHAGQYAYAGRKQNRRNLRRLWIQRLNAAVREHGMQYGVFIASLAKAKIGLDRKILSDIANSDPKTFEDIVKKVKAA